MSQRGVSFAVGADWLLAPEQTEKQVREMRAIFRIIAEETRARRCTKNAGRASEASTVDLSSMTAAEILRASLDSNQAPDDAATVKAFRFDRCYQPEDDGNLLRL
ncbi:hypothetical protein CPLU01_01335 [Colletotrichum plurivorum]|uniref:Uncharacterized protein n=1 Tax=Colletotrichum plurivorum TaxID=2175906 RepID=A0A8H6U4M0_9PEZI|nr:hypothetical protein CPLU01_01335 [Colletotrichum plurivorum]